MSNGSWGIVIFNLCKMSSFNIKSCFNDYVFPKEWQHLNGPLFISCKSMELYSYFGMFTPFYFYWVLISILIYFLSIIFYCEMTEFSKKYDPRMPTFPALQKYLLLDFYYLHLARIIRYFSPPEDSFVL